MNQEQDEQMIPTQIQDETTESQIVVPETDSEDENKESKKDEKHTKNQSDTKVEDSEKVQCQMCESDIEEDDPYCCWNDEDCKNTTICGSCLIECHFCMKKYCDKCMKGDKCISCDKIESKRKLENEYEEENPIKKIKSESQILE